jgi:nitrite reductase/ring-hydroxylating ferredoxin subunit
MSVSTDWIRIASTSEIAEGESHAIEIMGLSLALYHVGESWFCTDNVCTHAFALLTDGWLEEHIIECPLHGGQFDIRTGKALGAPVDIDLKTFPVRIEGDDILIALP